MTNLLEQQLDKNNRAIQLAFELNQTVSGIIRNRANQEGLSPSDHIRNIIGLQPKKPKRPRLSISLSEQDYRWLAQRYGLSPNDRNGIRKAISDELVAYSETVRQK